MKKTISRLLTLQDLEFQTKKPTAESRAIRAEISPDMLTRFDKFLSRGKKGVAVVQNGVCKGCQIGVPLGVVNALIQGVGAPVCGNCGRYLYLPEADADAFKAGSRNDVITVVKAPKTPSLRPKAPAKVRKTRKAAAPAA